MKFVIDILPAKGEHRQIEVDCGPDNDEDSYTTIGVHLRRDDGTDLALVHVDDFYRLDENFCTEHGEAAPASVYLHTFDQRSQNEPRIFHLTDTTHPHERAKETA